MRTARSGAAPIRTRGRSGTCEPICAGRPLGSFPAMVTAGLMGLVWAATRITTGTASPVRSLAGTTAVIRYRPGLD